MQKTFSLIFTALAVFTLFVIYPFKKKQTLATENIPLPVTPFKQTSHVKSNLDTGANWMASVQKDIERRMHSFSKNEKGNLLAFNKSNAYAVEITPEGTQIKNRKADGSPEEKSALCFSLLKTEIVQSNGKSIQIEQVNQPEIVSEYNVARKVHPSGLVEEFENTGDGLRQNYELLRLPEQVQSANAVHLYIHPGKNVRAQKDNEGINLYTKTDKGTEKKYTYTDLRAWDYQHRELRGTLEVKHGQICLNINIKDAIFPITIDPLLTSPSWMGESNQTTAYYGYSVSSAGDVNGDGYSDVIVGAFLYDNGQSNEGAALVYHGSSNGLSASSAWIGESNQTGAMLGVSVSSAGDLNGDGYSDVIVGAYGYDNGQSNEGAAFVYKGSSIGLDTSVAWIVESNQTGANYGFSVSNAGDVNGDGYSDVIIGAIYYHNGQTDEGAAFVYKGGSAGLDTSVLWNGESNQDYSYYGYSVSSAGDVNGDGYSDVIVGANNYSNGQSNEGIALLYYGSNSGLGVNALWVGEENQYSAAYGSSVSSAGDVNGDGYSDVIVGAPYFDNGQTNEGAAFLYLGSMSGLSTSASWTGESNQANASLGWSVSTTGDVNGDGYSDVIVGAPYFDNGQTDEGAAFVYLGGSNGLSSSASWTGESNQTSANYGISVSSAGDVNGDGYSDVVVGVPYFDNGQTDEGAAFVYHGNSSGLSTSYKWLGESNQATAFYGYSVASAGDVNGDGYSDVIVGAWYYDNGQTDEGAAFVYNGGINGLSNSASWTGESNQNTAYYGISVSSAGDVNGDGYADVIVGSFYFDNGQSNEGAAFVYHGSSSGLSASASWSGESNQDNGLYGYSTSSAGDVNGDGYSDIIVGAYNYDFNLTNGGAAFVYHGSSSGLLSSASWTGKSFQTNSYYGISVSSAGDVNGDGYSDVMVGANYFDNGQTDEGAAFVYHGSSNGLDTSASWTGESNQSSAGFGIYISTAGDVNGDGFSDIVVGAWHYDNGQTDEGAAFVYQGSSSGLSNVAAWMGESNQAGANYGRSVSCAGDVNGDGYSDVIIGANAYDNGQPNEGAAFVYLGHINGLDTSIAWSGESDQNYVYYSYPASSAGDVNGDGYSDIIVGCNGCSNGQSNEGVVFVYLGNNADTNSKRDNMRLYNANLTTPINASNYIQTSFGIGLYARSTMGRAKGRLVWEVKQQNDSFSHNSPMTNSTQYTGKQSSFTDLGLSGTELKDSIAKVSGSKSNKVRVRVEYSKATAINGQVYGPWRYLPTYTAGALGMGATPLPIELLSFTAWPDENHTARLEWVTSNLSPVQFFIQRSLDGIHFSVIGSVEELSHNGSFRYHDITLPKGTQKVYYRLAQHGNNGKTQYSNINTIWFGESAQSARVKVYPNPSKEKISLLCNSGETITSIRILNTEGKEIWMYKGQINDIELPSTLSKGVYILEIIFENQEREVQRLVKE